MTKKKSQNANQSILKFQTSSPDTNSELHMLFVSQVHFVLWLYLVQKSTFLKIPNKVFLNSGKLLWLLSCLWCFGNLTGGHLSLNSHFPSTHAAAVRAL